MGSRRKESGSGIAIDDCTSYCVRFGVWHWQNYQLRPPDGEFQLMSYRITQNVNLPLTVVPVIRWTLVAAAYLIATWMATLTLNCSANNVVMPSMHRRTQRVISRSLKPGKTKYDPATNTIIWKIPKVLRWCSYVLNGEVHLKALLLFDKAWQRPL